MGRLWNVGGFVSSVQACRFTNFAISRSRLDLQQHFDPSSRHHAVRTAGHNRAFFSVAFSEMRSTRATSHDVTRRPGVIARWRRLRAMLQGLLGLGLIAAQAPSVQAQAVPQHWIGYAQLASNQFQAWLSDPDNEAVVRLHEKMQDRLLNSRSSTPPGPLVVRVWVAADGKVYRVEFASLGDAQADADLHRILTAQPLSAPPPRDMRQPMALRLNLEFPT